VYYRHETWKRFPETLKVFREPAIFNEVFYLRKHRASDPLSVRQLGVTTPLLVLGLLLAALFFTARELREKSAEGRALGFLVLWLLFPMGLQAASGASMYDGMRHYLTVLPALAALAGYAGVRLIGLLPSRRAAIAGAAILAAGLLFVLVRLVALHPTRSSTTTH
jgi:4-amino-4-deoxy-L-arabinose transferase-like glycosyltransferase